MSLTQFLRILFARRWMVIAAVMASLVGAVLVILIVPPRYEASARVMLDMIKPDPVTGQILGTQFVRAYTQTQTELIKDYKVAGRVVDDLGWATDPAVVAEFDVPNDPEGARRGIARYVIDNTQAKVLEGSNILEIRYSAQSPDAAKLVAEAIRRAYLDISLAFKRDSFNQTADWYSIQTDKARRQLAISEQEMTRFEREHGLIMQGDKTDVDTARLAALSSQAEAPPGAALGPMMPTTSAAGVELATVDAQIAQLQRSLGPNHPTIRGLIQRRAGLAAQVSQDRAMAGAANAAARRAAGAASASSGSARRALETQKARVIANRDNIAKLRQLQDEVDLRRDQYQKAAARGAELRLQGAAPETGLTLLGSSVADEKPAFPKIPLILIGALFFGIVLGTLAALLTELLSRRVRSVRDLEHAAVDVPLLAVIGPEPKVGRPGWFARFKPSSRAVAGDPEEALAA